MTVFWFTRTAGIIYIVKKNACITFNYCRMKQSLRRLWKVKFVRAKLPTISTCPSISLPLSMKIPLPAGLFSNIRSSLMRKQAIESGNTTILFYFIYKTMLLQEGSFWRCWHHLDISLPIFPDLILVSMILSNLVSFTRNSD